MENAELILLRVKAKGFDLHQQLEQTQKHAQMLEDFIRRVGQIVGVSESEGRLDLQVILGALEGLKSTPLEPDEQHHENM